MNNLTPVKVAPSGPSIGSPTLAPAWGFYPVQRRTRPRKATVAGALLTLKQAAARLGVSERTLREHVRSGASASSTWGAASAARHAVRASRTSRISGKDRGAAWPSTNAARPTTTIRAPRFSTSRLYGLHVRAGSPSFERAKRQEAAKEAERREALGRAPLTWGVAATRYWQEIGQHHRRETGTLRRLEWMTDHIGESTALADITTMWSPASSPSVGAMASDPRPSTGP